MYVKRYKFLPHVHIKDADVRPAVRTAMVRCQLQLRMAHDNRNHSKDGSLLAYIVDRVLPNKNNIALQLEDFFVVPKTAKEDIVLCLTAKAWTDFAAADVYASVIEGKDGSRLFREKYKQGRDREHPEGAIYRCSDPSKSLNACCFRVGLKSVHLDDRLV